MSSALEISQIVKANEPELEAVLSFLGLDISGLIRSYNIEECIVTRGAKGGFVQGKSGRVHSYEAHRVDSVTDPTGAGDVFIAAYMVGRFLNKLNIKDASDYAARLAARQVGGKYITQDAISLPDLV
jgi:sugar/nucleoside kinase (ribokinase family)